VGQSADQIRREIDQSRDDAAAKIDQLQAQVQDTAQGVKDTAQETVDKVVDDVKATVDDTVAAVKQNLDLRQQIEQRPLVALGVAFVGGFLLGGVTGNDHHDHRSSGGYGYAPSRKSNGIVNQGLRSAVQKTGLEDTIANAAAALIGSVTDQAKSTIDQRFPGFADKMQSVQSSSGSFTEKAREATSM
jgi:ElaB/YqjD/DUF883 family membrane-anchored ribosome-binding protein